MYFGKCFHHYNDIIMGTIASQITSLTIVYSTVYSDADQRKHQSSASLAFVREIHRGPVNSPHKWPVTRKMFSFDDVIMISGCHRGDRSRMDWPSLEYAMRIISVSFKRYSWLYRYNRCSRLGRQLTMRCIVSFGKLRGLTQLCQITSWD